MLALAVVAALLIAEAPDLQKTVQAVLVVLATALALADLFRRHRAGPSPGGWRYHVFFWSFCWLCTFALFRLESFPKGAP
jgi:hypothetical protein